MIFKAIGTMVEKPVHMVLIPGRPASPPFAGVPLTPGLQLPCTKPMPCHLHHHPSTRTPPWESQARSAFQNNGFSEPFIDIFETISHTRTQILNEPQSNISKRDAVNFHGLHWKTHQGWERCIPSLELQLY